MKLLSLLKELNDSDIDFIRGYLNGLFVQFGYRFVITNHAAFDRLIRDKSRQNITRDDVVHTLEVFVRKCAEENNYSKKIASYKKSHKEIEGVITNLNNNLRIIFAIDFQHPPSSQGMYNFKIITAIVSDDFKTDARPFTEKFFIR